MFHAPGPHGPLAATALFALSAWFAPAALRAQEGPESLRTVPPPLPANLDDFVRDRVAAVRLGKALFWDEQAGGDGRVACATCHFQAGVDVRAVNTVHPGPNGVFDSGVLPGQELTAADFPIAGDDIVGSQGVVRADFVGLDGASPLAVDLCDFVDDGVFFPQRQVTGRNSPPTLMSIYNRVNFWDGRAAQEFNGVDGSGDEVAGILVDDGRGLRRVPVELEPASTASQAVGPPLSPVEMTCAGRSFAQMGRKLLGRTPLALQVVAPDDSALGTLSRFPGPGLETTYTDMVRAAFHARYHRSRERTADGFTQMEANFTLFWGLAILVYESTLVPDATPFDRYAEGDRRALTRRQLRGLEVWEGRGRCDQCHDGPAFNGAALRAGAGDAFANIGVTPTREDPGLRRGEFKTPTLRNVELTGPYFHNGRYLTLRQVVDFYDRGGDFDNDALDSQVRRLGLSNAEKEALVDFMLALTDDRVRYERAPFDHPSLNPPNGPPLPAVGAGGRALPLRPFLGADPFQR
ncbi:MAG: cytochrome-c peroxidase [Planctomycetota bacterium]